MFEKFAKKIAYFFLPPKGGRQALQKALDEFLFPPFFEAF